MIQDQNKQLHSHATDYGLQCAVSMIDSKIDSKIVRYRNSGLNERGRIEDVQVCIRCRLMFVEERFSSVRESTLLTCTKTYIMRRNQGNTIGGMEGGGWGLGRRL